MIPDIFTPLLNLGKALLVLCLLMAPLALWKLAEILIWLWSHVHFGPSA